MRSCFPESLPRFCSGCRWPPSFGWHGPGPNATLGFTSADHDVVWGGHGHLHRVAAFRSVRRYLDDDALALSGRDDHLLGREAVDAEWHGSVIGFVAPGWSGAVVGASPDERTRVARR